MTITIGALMAWILTLLFLTDGYSWKRSKVFGIVLICASVWLSYGALRSPGALSFEHFDKLTTFLMLPYISLGLSINLRMRLLATQLDKIGSSLEEQPTLNIFKPKLDYQLLDDDWRVTLYKINNWIFFILVIMDVLIFRLL